MVDEFQKTWSELKSAYPDVELKAKPIECLNLIMRKVFAKQIISGVKTVEFRSTSKHYYERLTDKNLMQFIKDHQNEELVMRGVDVGVLDVLRPVKKIHFHDYNNSWFLDVSVKDNGQCCPCNEDVKFLQDEYNCHDLDDVLSDMNAKRQTERPLFYFFVIDKVLDTNLK